MTVHCIDAEQSPGISRTSGDGFVELTRVSGRSAVTRCVARSPLRLLTPRTIGECAWVFAGTYGGGLVGGDSIRLDVHAKAGTRCLLSTQASTKIYRAEPLGCTQDLSVTLESGAILVCAPDPVVCYEDADFTQRQRFSLAPDSSLIMVDWLTSGRWARGERWSFSRYKSQNEIFVGERCIFRDRLSLDPADAAIDGSMRMGFLNCFATVVVFGVELKENIEELLRYVTAQPAANGDPVLFSASPIECGIVLRVAGPNSETVGAWIRQRLGFVVPLLGQDPWARKW